MLLLNALNVYVNEGLCVSCHHYSQTGWEKMKWRRGGGWFGLVVLVGLLVGWLGG